MNHSKFRDKHEVLLHASAPKRLQQTVLRAKELAAVSQRVSEQCRESLGMLGRSVNQTELIARNPVTACSRLMPVAKTREPSENILDKTLTRNSIALIKEMIDLLREIIASGDKEAFYALQKTIRTCARTSCRASCTIH
jgi:hypothetical protein